MPDLTEEEKLTKLISDYEEALLQAVDLTDEEVTALVNTLKAKLRNSYVDALTGRVIISSTKPVGVAATGPPTYEQLLDYLPEFDVLRRFRRGQYDEVQKAIKAEQKSIETYKEGLVSYLRQQGIQAPPTFGSGKTAEETLLETEQLYNQIYGLRASGLDESGQATGYTTAAMIAQQQELQPKLTAIERQQAEQRTTEKRQLGAIESRAEEQQQQYRQAVDLRAKKIMTPRQPPEITQLLSEVQGSAPNYNLGRYMSQKMPEAVRQFETKYPGAREAWYGALYPYQPYEGSIGKEVSIPSGGTERALAYSKQVASDLGVSGTNLTPTTDPMSVYLKNYPWYQEFMKQPAAQRGYNPTRYAPSARWLTG